MNRLNNAKEFVLAGNATFTLESEDTKRHFTYKMTKSDNNDNLFFVKLLNGPDNTTDYAYIGCYFVDTGHFHPVKKYRDMIKSSWPPSIRAIKFFFDNINDIPHKLHVYHEGRCGRCGRKLTTPESILRGFGPECSKL